MFEDFSQPLANHVSSSVVWEKTNHQHRSLIVGRRTCFSVTRVGSGRVSNDSTQDAAPDFFFDDSGMKGVNAKHLSCGENTKDIGNLRQRRKIIANETDWNNICVQRKRYVSIFEKKRVPLSGDGNYLKL